MPLQDKLIRKIRMIEDLRDMEVAARILEDDEGKDVSEDPVDAHYKKLKTNLVPLDRESDEFKLVEVCKICSLNYHGCKLTPS